MHYVPNILWARKLFNVLDNTKLILMEEDVVELQVLYVNHFLF